jgi:hypothetical protein
MKKAYFGFEVTFPDNATITVSEIGGQLRKDGATYKSNTIPRYLAPGASTFPYCVVLNAAGQQTSVNNTLIVGTQVQGKKLVVGAMRWSFGTNQPSEQPLLGSAPGSSYAEGLVLRGTYTISGGAPIAFEFLPGDPMINPEGNTKYAFAVVGVRNDMDNNTWVNQLKNVAVARDGNGNLYQTLSDPSGLMTTPGGKAVSTSGWETSLDLLEWNPFDSDVQFGITVSGNALTMKLRPGGQLGPKRFFRFNGGGAVSTNTLSWWPNQSNNT